jgi:glutamyl-tRNA synthetase
MSIDHSIEKFALANAVKFNGRANPGAIIGHVISEYPDAKSDMKSVAKKIAEAVAKINKLPVDEQLRQLQEKYPEMLEKKEVEERDIFAFLKIPEGATVKSAYPPGPEKYPHIGHAKASILNYLLAKKYNGKFVLRFEDTNPELVKSEFYDMIVENLTWLGVEWDDLQYASDHMKLFYDFAEKIIKSNHAYMCTCEVELMRDNRQKGIECECRDRSAHEHLELWHKFSSMPAGSAVLRLKIDLKHDNSTMRDPTIFRLIDTPHARTGTKYRVWPNYDFQNAIMDGYFNVTHRLRSKEFEMRSELQRYIQKLLGLHTTVTYEFARFNLEGVESSGRVIREKVNSGEYVGWDDPRLTTIVALRRRGFTPEAIKNFVLSTGMTKSEATLTWDDLILHNKRILDENADRFFFIKDPMLIKIHGAPEQDIELNRHPHHRKGGRHFKTHEEFYITKEDLDSLKDGELYRFMDCLNFTKKHGEFQFNSLDHTKYKERGKRIMHYLPKSGHLMHVEVMMPDKTIVTGLGEERMKELKVGDIIQAERFGFMRLDSIEHGKLKFWYTHN